MHHSPQPLNQQVGLRCACRQLEEKARKERSQQRAEVRGPRTAVVPAFARSNTPRRWPTTEPATYPRSSQARWPSIACTQACCATQTLFLQRRTKLKHELGLPDDYGVGSSDDEAVPDGERPAQALRDALFCHLVFGACLAPSNRRLARPAGCGCHAQLTHLASLVACGPWQLRRWPTPGRTRAQTCGYIPQAA